MSNQTEKQFCIPETKKALNSRGITTNTDTWLVQKAQRDTALWGCPQKYWIIENNMYDLSNFAKNHPGGSHWIQYTKGHEITQLFRVHHLDIEKARTILNKYYVGQCPIKRQPRFNFDQQGTYQTLRKKILQEFSVSQLHDSKQTNFRCAVIFIIWCILFIIVALTKSYISAIICGIYMVQFYGVGHIYIHKKPNIFMNAYLIIGFTPKQQIIMHCISHHVYTNTLLDYQFAGFEPIVYFTRSLPKNKLYSIVLSQILFIVVSFANILLKLFIVPPLTRTLPDFRYFYTLLEWVFLTLMTGDIILSFKLFAIMHFGYGLTFGNSVLCQHRSPKLWTQGQLQIKDYVKHTIATTYETGNNEGGYLALLMHQGFGIHVLHHLFPTIDLDKLPRVQKILEQVIQQKGLKLFTNKKFLQCNKKFYHGFFNRQKFDEANIVRGQKLGKKQK